MATKEDGLAVKKPLWLRITAGLVMLGLVAFFPNDRVASNFLLGGVALTLIFTGMHEYLKARAPLWVQNLNAIILWALLFVLIGAAIARWGFGL